ncbi:hypothetical protein BDY21DRAFT_215283 [Lineolata rhizophorae]|uniref:Uncharacterized protein n=1 Tax=Lineolata rhizophorae TaxID=578093 RepID=A0A6A6P2F7_9PEZI|nr:hypothetical protein BDY21DRAFT_215283 [Lineolata rhizophorae]
MPKRKFSASFPGKGEHPFGGASRVDPAPRRGKHMPRASGLHPSERDVVIRSIVTFDGRVIHEQETSVPLAKFGCTQHFDDISSSTYRLALAYSHRKRVTCHEVSRKATVVSSPREAPDKVLATMDLDSFMLWKALNHYIVQYQTNVCPGDVAVEVTTAYSRFPRRAESRDGRRDRLLDLLAESESLLRCRDPACANEGGYCLRLVQDHLSASQEHLWEWANAIVDDDVPMAAALPMLGVQLIEKRAARHRFQLKNDTLSSCIAANPGLAEFLPCPSSPPASPTPPLTYLGQLLDMVNHPQREFPDPIPSPAFFEQKRFPCC